MSEQVKRGTNCHEDGVDLHFCYICGNQASCVGYGGFLCGYEFCQIADDEEMEADCYGSW
jgi:hypothetical protein